MKTKSGNVFICPISTDKTKVKLSSSNLIKTGSWTNVSLDLKLNFVSCLFPVGNDRFVLKFSNLS